MARTHLGVLRHVGKVVLVSPLIRHWIKRVQVIEALSVGPRPAKQVEFLTHVAQGHASARSWALTLNENLVPLSCRQIESKQVVEALGAVPAPENVKFVRDDARAVVSTRGWWLTGGHDSGPLQFFGVQLVQIIEVVAAITAPKHVNHLLVPVCRMHVARAR